MSTEDNKRNNTPVFCVRQLSNQDLLDKLRELLCEEHALEVELLMHIGEVDRRRLYRERAFSCMFRYCVDELCLSESVAYKRIAVARAARVYPVLLEKIQNGELHLTGACLLVPHLTEDNAFELIAAAKHQSKRAIEKLLAARFVRPDISARVRKLPTPTPLVAAPQHTPVGTPSVPLMPRADENSSAVARRSEIAPLSAERYKVVFTADAQLRAKLQKAIDLLGPNVPRSDLATVFSKALDLLISDLENKKHGVTSRPHAHREKASKGKKASRTIPRSVRREVYERDGGQCAFVSDDGRRCEESSGLEYHHRVPFGRGGSATVANVELRCKSHNQLAAEQDYGGASMSRYWAPSVREVRLDYRVSKLRVTGSGGSAGPLPHEVAPVGSSGARFAVRA
jgi:5-methylcytosine-specific restriction endonuclease McrA